MENDSPCGQIIINFYTGKKAAVTFNGDVQPLNIQTATFLMRTQYSEYMRMVGQANKDNLVRNRDAIAAQKLKDAEEAAEKLQAEDQKATEKERAERKEQEEAEAKTKEEARKQNQILEIERRKKNASSVAKIEGKTVEEVRAEADAQLAELVPEGKETSAAYAPPASE